MTPSPSLKRKRTPTRSPSSWSPRTKSAARTIKRIVTKKYTQGKYRNYTTTLYGPIRRGEFPAHKSALLRRMRMFPVTVNFPLYRGINYKLGENALRNGKLVNNSFSSFSKIRGTARLFGTGGGSSVWGHMLVLPPGRYPAINRGRFINNYIEREITLAPGVYTVNGLTNKGNIRVTYKPLNRSPRGH